MPLAIEAPVVYPDARPMPLSRGGMVSGVLPGCRPPAPITPPQPALVIRDALSKSIDGADLLEIHKSLAKGAIPVSSPRTVPDVSTPQHEHARLQAKKVYLEERLAGHRNAGHPESHPQVHQRQHALANVNEKIKNYEAAGIKSGPEHHDDWMKYYAANPGKRFSEEHVSAGLSAHLGHLGGSEVRKQRAQIAGHEGPMKIETETAPHDVAHAMKKRPPAHEILSQLRSQQNLAAIKSMINMLKGEGKKSDSWISNKIRLLMHEGKPQDQAIAIAYSMAGRSRVKKSNPLLIVSA